MSVRHLDDRQADFALRRGKQIEQLLDRFQLPDGRWSLRWLSVYPMDGHYAVGVHHVEDIGDGSPADLSQFPPVDPQEPWGEGKVLGAFETSAQALAAASRFGARPDRWVNAAVIASEYHDLRRREAT